jgi:hypothetical protein
MSRSNPAGFALGILVEVAAIVFVVSLLPRIDLQPPADPLVADREPAFSEVPASQWRAPPSLIAVDPDRPGQIERQLDRASQQLINTVGSYAIRTADNVARALPPPASDLSQATTRPTAQAQSDLPQSLSPTVHRQPHPSDQPPRPWIRY